MRASRQIKLKLAAYGSHIVGIQRESAEFIVLDLTSTGRSHSFKVGARRLSPASVLTQFHTHAAR